MGMQGGYTKNTDKIIQRTEGNESATVISFGNLHEKLFGLQNVGQKKKKGGLGDGYSDAMTIYNANSGEAGVDNDMKSLKSKKSKKRL